MYSLQSITLRAVKKILKKERSDVKKTPAGLEYWEVTPAGTLLTRQSNINWLIERFENKGLILKKRIAYQFTEIYTRFSSGLIKQIIHKFNIFWFRYIKAPHPAFGNILILQKTIQ
jgi:hypothetical protein